jgi:hypothetical protein
MRLLSLALALAFLAAWPAAAKTPLPTFAEKTTYSEARAQLIAKGYAPMRNGGKNWNDCEDHPDLCRRFPELTNCIQNAPVDCAYLWKTPDEEYLVLWADSCCDQWVFSSNEFYGPKLIPPDEAREILSPPDPDLPRLSRKLLYPEVRRRLAKLGYLPQAIVAGRSEYACLYPYKALCRRYPEVEECAKFCDFYYRRPRDGRWLIVRTDGERGYPFHEVRWATKDSASSLKFAGGMRPPKE